MTVIAGRHPDSTLIIISVFGLSARTGCNFPQLNLFKFRSSFLVGSSVGRWILIVQSRNRPVIERANSVQGRNRSI